MRLIPALSRSGATALRGVANCIYQIPIANCQLLIAYMRHDIHGVERAPSDIEEYLLRVGGRNPFGEPMWRLVLAGNVIWKVQGGKVWDENLTIAERGGIDVSDGRRYENRPVRDEADRLVEQRRYPHLEGWILQKWFPASSYNKAQWFEPQHCMADGTPKLGPYPQFGDYEMMAGPMERLPGKQQIHEFISAYYRGLESRHSSVETRMREMLNALEYEERRQVRDAREFMDEYMRDKCSYITSSSLEAGRVRTERAEKLGIREHVGN